MSGLAPNGVVATGLAPTAGATNPVITASITEAADTLTSALASGAPAALGFVPTGLAPTGTLGFIVMGGGGGGVSITGNTSEAADASSGAAGVLVVASASITEAADTLTSAVGAGGGSGAATAGFSAPTGTVPVGVLPITQDAICDISAIIVEAADTVTSTMTNGGGMTASASITEAADTLTCVANVVTPGSVVGFAASIDEVADAAVSALVEASDTGSGAIVVPLGITANIIEAADTSLSLGERSDTLTSATAVDVFSNTSITEVADTLTSVANASSGTAVLLNASIDEVADASHSALTEAADTGGGAIVSLVGITAATTDVADTTTSSVSVISGRVLNAAIVEGADTLAANANVSGSGPVDAVFDASINEALDTTVAEMFVTGGPPVTINANITEAADSGFRPYAPPVEDGGGGPDSSDRSPRGRDKSKPTPWPAIQHELASKPKSGQYLKQYAPVEPKPVVAKPAPVEAKVAAPKPAVSPKVKAMLDKAEKEVAAQREAERVQREEEEALVLAIIEHELA